MRLALALVAALATSAAASPLIVPPAGWKGGASDEAVHQTGALPHFGGVHGIVEAMRYDPPKPGVVLYASRVTATTAAHDAAARAEIDLLHPSPDSGEHETAWQESTDPAARQAEATLGWRDPSTQASGHARLVIAATADKIVAVKGECIEAGDADPAVVQACQAALATLDPGVAASDRIAIDLDAAAKAQLPAASPPPSSMGEPPPHVPVVIPVPASRARPRTDLRPVFVGAGILALAGVFWWNRRRRARYQAENRADNRPDDR